MKTIDRKRTRSPQNHGRPARNPVQPTTPTAKAARRVLVATDGSQASTAAIRFARSMADRGAWAPEAVSVFEPIPVSVGEFALPMPNPQQDVALTTSLTARIRKQLRRSGAASWNFVVELGRPAPSIVSAARDRRAEVIVLGLGQHGAIARLFGAETASRVMRHSDVPVLAVHQRTRRLPHVALVAVDFGASSTRAAREALALLEPPGRLHLVHIGWGHNLTTLGAEEWERAYAYGVERGFTRIRNEIGTKEGIEITTEFLHGGVVQAILDAARLLKADAIALGSHGQSMLDRLVIGSTPSQVLRIAPCSVLVAPPDDANT